MLLGRVVGTLVATRKEPSLEGLRFMVVRRLTIDNEDTDGYVVAADAVGAGVGEVVLYATGSSARQTRLTHERPNDAVIMAIVDTWEVDGQVKYVKVEGLEAMGGDWLDDAYPLEEAHPPDGKA
jgi:microcompartment protein CcmK/EutM